MSYTDPNGHYANVGAFRDNYLRPEHYLQHQIQQLQHSQRQAQWNAIDSRDPRNGYIVVTQVVVQPSNQHSVGYYLAGAPRPPGGRQCW